MGKHQPLNCLVAAHWTWHNRRGFSHRLERVPTKANISDGLSRFEDVPEAWGWIRLEFPPNALTIRAKKIIGDIEFASCMGFSDVPKGLPIVRRAASSGPVTSCGVRLRWKTRSPPMGLRKKTFLYEMWKGRKRTSLWCESRCCRIAHGCATWQLHCFHAHTIVHEDLLFVDLGEHVYIP